MVLLRSFLFITLTGLLLGLGCNKEIPPRELEMNPEPMKYMCFKEGTYWEYVDTATGERRSVDVIADSFFYFEIKQSLDNPKVMKRLETFEWTTNTATYQAMQINHDSIGHRAITFRVNKRLKQNGGGLTTVFFYPFNKDFSYNPHGSTQVNLNDQLDSLEVLGETYEDVVAFRDISNFTEGGQKTITYIAKHHGIIRIDIHIPREIKNDGTIIPAYWKRFLLTNAKIVQ